MGKSMKYIGGFAALNAGTIADCYSAVQIRANCPVSGFCAENRSGGQIRNCMFRGRLKNGKRAKSGLVGQQSGTMDHCFWIRREKEPREKDYTDWGDSRTKADFADGAEIDGWDMDSTWHCEKGVFELYDVADHSNVGPGGYAEVVEITSREDLLNLAAAVNEGTAKKSVLYRLTGDIDLGGREWTPIGADSYKPFRSGFDGDGHIIKNFRVKTQKHPYAGLFGCAAEGAVICNLTVDCILSGKGNYSGPLCGLNEGAIHNCVARSQCSFSRYTGGFVGRNEGVITRSCALGGILALIPFPWWLPLLLLFLLSSAVTVTFYLNACCSSPKEIFAPVIIDPNAKPVEDVVPMPEPGALKESNATFIMNAEMAVSTTNYAGAIGLRNPSWSDWGFVATIRVTAGDMAAHGIPASEEYYTIYQSGLIQPGYGVDVITLSALPDGTRLPEGSYEFSVLFEFYNVETNEKHAIDSTAPLDVVIR